jgi:hypothetical protein
MELKNEKAHVVLYDICRLGEITCRSMIERKLTFDLPGK